MRLGVGHHLLQRIGWEFRARHQDAGRFAGERQRDEIALRFDGELRKEIRIDRHGADIAEEQRVAVRLRVGGELHADAAARHRRGCR